MKDDNMFNKWSSAWCEAWDRACVTPGEVTKHTWKKVAREMPTDLLAWSYKQVWSKEWNHIVENELADREIEKVLSQSKKKEINMSDWNFIAKPNPNVKGEWEIWLNGDIFCHLSDSNLQDFISCCKYPVNIEE